MLQALPSKDDSRRDSHDEEGKETEHIITPPNTATPLKEDPGLREDEDVGVQVSNDKACSHDRQHGEAPSPASLRLVRTNGEYCQIDLSDLESSSSRTMESAGIEEDGDPEKEPSDVMLPKETGRAQEKRSSSSPSRSSSSPSEPCLSLSLLWKYTGPGFLMSIAYIDPGNLESDLQAGAYAGYSLLWVLFLSTLCGLLYQILAARVGFVTGKNLAELCRSEYPKWASFTMWLLAEVAIIGSDVQAVLGSAIAFEILLDIPLWVGCLITMMDSLLFMSLHFCGEKRVEAFLCFLIAIMLFCFFANLLQSNTSVEDLIVGSLVPRGDRSSFLQAIGLLGAVIMPHNIYLHSALVQDRREAMTARTGGQERERRKIREGNKYLAIESALALLVAFLTNAAVIGAFAAGFFSEDCKGLFATMGENFACVPPGVNASMSVGECQLQAGAQSGVCAKIGLSDAGSVLNGLLGKGAEIVWALGLLAAGQSTTMTGTFAGQYVMEGFLEMNIEPWKRVLITRCLALIPASLVAVAHELIPSMTDQVDEILNVSQSILIPIAILPVIHFARSKRHMGEYAIGKRVAALSWGVFSVIIIANLAFLSSFLEFMSLSLPLRVLLVTVAGLYVSLLAFIVKDDLPLSSSSCCLKQWREREVSSIMAPSPQRKNSAEKLVGLQLT